MKHVLLALLMAAPSVFAEDEFKVFVNTFDSDLDKKSIESPKVAVTQGAGTYRSRVAIFPVAKRCIK